MSRTGRNIRNPFETEVTDGHEQDPSQVPNLRTQVDREIDRFVGDRIYDQEMVYEAVDHHSPGAEVIVPLRKDAVLSNNSISVPSTPYFKFLGFRFK